MAFPHLTTRRALNPLALPPATSTAEGAGSAAIVFAVAGTGASLVAAAGSSAVVLAAAAVGASLSASAGSAAVVFAVSGSGDSTGGAVTPRQRIARRRVRYLARVA